VLLAVLWRLRYKLSFRDLAEILLQRGFEATHETVCEWEFRFAPTASFRPEDCPSKTGDEAAARSPQRELESERSPWHAINPGTQATTEQ
jgi:hypothetical protein